MSANKRIYYACERVGIAPLGSTSYQSVRGAQNCGLTTTFNLTQAFELGQLAIYENIEGIPDVEATIEKLLDGAAPVYTLATQLGTSATLAGRSNARCSLALGIYADTVDSVSGSPTIANVELSGLYMSSVGYALRADGNATETCTLVGNNKVWKQGGVTFSDDPFCWNTDTPPSGIQRRQHLILGDGGSKIPSEIPGVDGDGYVIADGAGDYPTHLQSVSARCNLGRDQLFELGRRGPYYRFVRFPVEVTSEFSIIATSGDGISATEDGIYGEQTTCANPYNLTDQTIILKFCDTLTLNLGTKNKLSSVGMTGGDAGGGNLEVTYTYTNFNDFTVYHMQDPNYGEAGFAP